MKMIASLVPLMTILWSSIGVAENPPELLASLEINDIGDIAWSGSEAIYYTDGEFVHMLNRQLWDLSHWHAPICYPLGLSANTDYVYVTNIDWESDVSCSMDDIARFTPDGSFVNSWCRRNTPPDPNLGCGAVHLALDATGRLYANSNGKIRRYDASGNLELEWGTNDDGRFFGTMSVGPDGNLYVPDMQAHKEVLRFDPELTEFEVFIPYGVGDGNVLEPRGVAVGPDGTLYVVDTATRQVKRFDVQGDFLGAWSTLPYVPWGPIAVDSDGYLYLGTSRQLLKYDNKPGPGAVPPHPPAVLLHVGKVTGRGLECESIPNSPSEVQTKGTVDASGTARYYVYILASPSTIDVNLGLTGLQMGLNYAAEAGSVNDAFSLFGWNPCSVLDFPQDGWPASGTGNTITWMADVCQKQEMVLAGYMYMSAYAPGTLSITPYPVTGLAKIAICGGAEMVVDPSDLGWVAFGGAENITGCNPIYQDCTKDLVPVNRTTWGRLKERFIPEALNQQN